MLRLTPVNLSNDDLGLAAQLWPGLSRVDAVRKWYAVATIARMRRKRTHGGRHIHRRLMWAWAKADAQETQQTEPTNTTTQHIRLYP